MSNISDIRERSLNPNTMQFQQRRKNVPIPSPLNLSYQANDIDELDQGLSFEAKPIGHTLKVDYRLSFHSNIKPHPPIQSNTCTICNFYIDEDLLELSCGHICHRDCFLNNVLTCKTCDSESLTDSGSLIIPPTNQQLLPPPSINKRDAITPKFGPVDIPMTPSDQMIPDPLKVQNGIRTPAHLVSELTPINSHSNFDSAQQQLMSPRTSFNKNLNKDLFDNLMKPKIKFLTETPNQKNVLNPNDKDNENYLLNYIINVKPPKFLSTMDNNKSLTLKNQIYDEIKFSILKNIVNWNDDGLIDFTSMGKLIIFEIVDISTNGTNWDQVRLFLFERSLLLIDIKGEVLIGQIHIRDDILDMRRFVSGLRLQLNNDTIPELQLCSDIPLIISRLEYYFKKLLNGEFISETSVLQLTTNGWNLIKDNYSNLPVEALRFQNCIENNLEIPEELLVKSMPPPEIAPVNLILCITLLNSSKLTNQEYRFKIIEFLDNVRKTMRPYDKLSLIFVGLNGSGVPCKKGSFIGGVEPNWSGWDSIYNEVKVQSNFNSHGSPILTSGWDELSISLEKCKDLFPFLSSNIININKLIIISANDYDPVLISNTELGFIENQFKALLLNTEKNLSVDFFRIGTNYTPELEFGVKTVLQPSLINNDVLRIPYGCKLLRFDNFDEFSSNFIDILKTNYHKIVLPSIALDVSKIIGSRELVDFYKIEVNGKLIEVKNFCNLKIMINNVTSDSERNIMLNMALNLSKLRFENLNYCQERVIDLPLLSYSPSWLNESADYQVLNTKIYDRHAQNVSYTDGNLTPPMNGTEEESWGSPPQSTEKNKKFLKKQIELEVVKNLKYLNDHKSPGTNASKVLQNTIDYILQSKRLWDSDEVFVKSNTISFERKDMSNLYETSSSFSNYMDSLLSQLTFLSDICNNNELDGVVACKDFTNWLV